MGLIARTNEPYRWFAYGENGQSAVLRTDKSVTEYRDAGWQVMGPYVEAAALAGAVAALDSAIGLADHWAPKAGPDAEHAARELAELRALANRYGGQSE